MTDAGRDEALLTVRDLAKSYSVRGMHVTAFTDLSFDVDTGRILAVIGPSGSGKSTLLKCIGGLVAASGGTIAIGGEYVTGQVDARNNGKKGSERAGFVFQEPRLLPWQTVAQNVAFGLRSTGRRSGRKPRIRSKVTELLDLVSLHEFAAAYPAQLSGGMRQRVALARGLAIDPDLLLLDEPLSALDELTKKRLADELLEIVYATGKTAVWVTHDLDEALIVGDEVLVLNGQPSTATARFDVPFERPRRAVSLSKKPEYIDLRIRLLESLSGDDSAAG